MVILEKVQLKVKKIQISGPGGRGGRAQIAEGHQRPFVGDGNTLYQRSPSFLAPGTSFMEDGFSTDGGGGWLRR